MKQTIPGSEIINIGYRVMKNIHAILLIEILTFSVLMIVCALFFPKALAIVGLVAYIFVFRKVALLPKSTAWKDTTILLTVLITSTLAMMGIWITCYFLPYSNSCTVNSVRGHIFSFYLFPLIPYLIFFLVMSMPQYLKSIFRHR